MKAKCPGCGKVLVIDEKKLKEKIKPESSPFKIIVFVVGVMYSFTILSVLINLNSQINLIQKKQFEDDYKWESLDRYNLSESKYNETLSNALCAFATVLSENNLFLKNIKNQTDYIHNKFNTASVLKKAKPDYVIGQKYKLQVPVEVYPQVFETDVTTVDSSVASSMYYGTETIPKNTTISIKGMKFCNRTESWWVKCDGYYVEYVGDYEAFNGWFNNDALNEYPLLAVQNKKRVLK